MWWRNFEWQNICLATWSIFLKFLVFLSLTIKWMFTIMCKQICVVLQVVYRMFLAGLLKDHVTNQNNSSEYTALHTFSSGFELRFVWHHVCETLCGFTEISSRIPLIVITVICSLSVIWLVAFTDRHVSQFR